MNTTCSAHWKTAVAAAVALVGVGVGASAFALRNEPLSAAEHGELVARTGSTQTPFLFVGAAGVRSEGGTLYRMGARFYDAGLRRFLSPDPLGIDGGFNLYADADPVNHVDPLGLCAERGIPSFTSSFGSEQFEIAASGWYGGTGIRPNTAQRVIAGAWGVVQAVAEVLTLGAFGGAGAIGTRGVIAGGSTLTAVERAYMTGAYSAPRALVAKPMLIAEEFAGTAGRRLTQTLAGQGAPSIHQGQHIVDTAVTEFLPRLKLRARPRYNRSFRESWGIFH